MSILKEQPNRDIGFWKNLESWYVMNRHRHGYGIYMICAWGRTDTNMYLWFKCDRYISIHVILLWLIFPIFKYFRLQYRNPQCPCRMNIITYCNYSFIPEAYILKFQINDWFKTRRTTSWNVLERHRSTVWSIFRFFYRDMSRI